MKSHDACLYKIAYATDAAAAGDKWHSYLCVYCGAFHRSTPLALKLSEDFQAKKKGHLDWMVRSALRKMKQKEHV